MGKITATHVYLLVALKGGRSVSEAARQLGKQQPPTSALIARVEKALPFEICTRTHGAFEALNAAGEALATTLAKSPMNAGAAAALMNDIGAKDPRYTVGDVLEAFERKPIATSNGSLKPSPPEPVETTPLTIPYHLTGGPIAHVNPSLPLRISAPIVGQVREMLLLELINGVGSNLRCTLIKDLAWTDTLLALATGEIDVGMCRSSDDGERYPDGYAHVRMQDDPFDRIVFVSGQPDPGDDEEFELSLRQGAPAMFPPSSQPHLRLALDRELLSRGFEACYDDVGHKIQSGLVWKLATETMADEAHVDTYFEQRLLRVGAGIDLVYRSSDEDDRLPLLLGRVKDRLVSSNRAFLRPNGV